MKIVLALLALAWVLCGFAFVLVMLVRYLLLQRKIINSYACFDQHSKKVVQIDCVASVIYAEPRKKITYEGKEFWSDAAVVVVLKNKYGLSGLIGCYLTKSTLEVRQMQGFRGARFKRGQMPKYFHDAIDEIAKVLEVRRVCILPAKKNRWYKRPYGVTEEKVPALRERMRNLYDKESCKRGYRCRFGRWQKKRT